MSSEYDDHDYVPDLPDEWVDDATLRERRQRRMERKEPNRANREDNPPPPADDHVIERPPEPTPNVPREVRQLLENTEQWVETREQREDGLRRSMRQKEQRESHQASNLGQLPRGVCATIFGKLWKHTVGEPSHNADYNYLYDLLMYPEFGIKENLISDVNSRCTSLLKD